MPEMDLFVGEREPEVTVHYDNGLYSRGNVWLELRNDSVSLTPQEAITLSKYLLMAGVDLDLRANATKTDGKAAK